MRTLLEGVREGEGFIKKETLEPSLERFLSVREEDVLSRGKL